MHILKSQYAKDGNMGRSFGNEIDKGYFIVGIKPGSCIPVPFTAQI